MDNNVNIGGMAKLMRQLDVFKNEDILKVLLSIAENPGITFKMIQKNTNIWDYNKLTHILWVLKQDSLISRLSKGYFLTEGGQDIANLIEQIATDSKFKEMIEFLEMKAYQSAISNPD